MTKTKLLFTKSNLKVDISKIDNPLAKKKSELVNKTLEQTSQELLDDKKFNGAAAFYLANGIQFNINNIPTFEKHKLRDLLIPEEVQRLLDKEHCTKITKNFDPRLLSPVYVVRLLGSSDLLVFDSMHTVTEVAALARLGLWKGVDPANWLDLEYPCWVIDTDQESFPSRAALYRNGEGSKPWGPYDYHRVYVRSFNLYGDAGPNNKYKLAAEKQKICEREYSIPLPKNHPQVGKAGTFSHIEAMDGYSESDMDEFNFIMSMNNKYWHGSCMDSAVWGFYGKLYEGFSWMDVPMSGADFDKFMDDIHAIIKTFFTSMTELRTTTTTTFREWKSLQVKNPGTTPFNCALAIVLKIYKRLGGTHSVTTDAIDFIYEAAPGIRHDIYDYLPLSVRQDVSNYTL